MLTRVQSISRRQIFSRYLRCSFGGEGQIRGTSTQSKGDKDANLTEIHPTKQIIKHSMSMVPLQLIKGALPFANSMLLSRLGSSTRASATLINTLVDVNYLLFSSPLFCISAAVGALNTPEERKNIGEVVHAGWILSAICTLPQVLIMHFNVPLLIAAGQDPELVNIANDFLKIYIYAVPIVNLQSVSEQAIFATKSAYLPLMVQVISFGVWGAVACSASFGLMGFPELGVQGAAYAYLGRVYFNSVLFHSILLYKNQTDATFSEYNIFRLQPGSVQRLKEISGNALSIFGLFLLETGEIYLPNLFAGKIGSVELAAQLLVSQYQELILFAVSGVAISSQVMVANALGNKQFQRIKVFGNTGVKLAMCLPLAYTGVVLLAPEFLMQLFIDINDSDNQGLIDLLVNQKVLLISGLNISMISFRMAAGEALIGVGKAGFPMIRNMAVSWVGIALGYALGFAADMGLPGVNGGVTVGLLLSSMAQALLWYKTANTFSKKNLSKDDAQSSTSKFFKPYDKGNEELTNKTVENRPKSP